MNSEMTTMKNSPNPRDPQQVVLALDRISASIRKRQRTIERDVHKAVRASPPRSWADVVGDLEHALVGKKLMQRWDGVFRAEQSDEEA